MNSEKIQSDGEPNENGSKWDVLSENADGTPDWDSLKEVPMADSKETLDNNGKLTEGELKTAEELREKYQNSLQEGNVPEDVLRKNIQEGIVYMFDLEVGQEDKLNEIMSIVTGSETRNVEPASNEISDEEMSALKEWKEKYQNDLKTGNVSEEELKKNLREGIAYSFDIEVGQNEKLDKMMDFVTGN